MKEARMTPRSRSRARHLVAAALAMTLAACGNGGGTDGGSQTTPVDDDAAIRQAVQGYFTALADGSYEEACAYLSDQALEQLSQFPEYTGDCEGSLATTFGGLPE